jgi:hypothetical protein
MEAQDVVSGGFGEGMTCQAASFPVLTCPLLIQLSNCRSFVSILQRQFWGFLHPKQGHRTLSSINVGYFKKHNS